MAATIVFGSILLKIALEFMILATGCLLAVVIGLVLVEIYSANKAYHDYKRKSNGLFMCGDRSLLCNHTVSWGLRKDPLNYMMKYSKEQGQNVLGWLLHTQPSITSFDPEFMKRVVLDEPNKNINRAKIDAPCAEFMEDSIMLAEGDQWRRLRRAVAPALRASKFKAPNVMREFDTSINKLIEAIENKLSACEAQAKETDAGVTVNADELVHRYTLDLVFRCFYKQQDLIDFNADHCHWTELVDEGLEAPMTSFFFKLGLTIRSLRRPFDWLMMTFHRQGKWRRELIEFIQKQTKLSLEARKQIEALKAEGKEVNEDDFQLRDGTRFQRNLADHMTDHLLDGKITQREYFNTAGFLINAADKTTNDALVHTIYRIAIDQRIQNKLRESIEVEGLESTYLDWVVSESLRLLPPAPVGCSRTIVEEMEIEGGKVLPAGTLISYPNYIVHRLKKYWGEDADEFKPERFAEADKFHPLQYVPFGAGVRVCPGREFALFEIKELLSRLLMRYKFHCEPKDDAYVFDSPFLIYILFNSPTYIKITRRMQAGRGE